MKQFRWDPVKNAQLLRERQITFEIIVWALAEGHLLDIVAHPHPERYPHQQLLIVECNRYAYLVPCVEAGDEIFLKTIIPSRKATQQYLRKEEP